MTDDVLSCVRIKWDDLCSQPALNRFSFDRTTQQIYNQKGRLCNAQLKHEKWVKGEKEIILMPDVPKFVLQLASQFASQPQRPYKASNVKQAMGNHTGFNKEDLEILLGIALTACW